jgi:hypothetical protein
MKKKLSLFLLSFVFLFSGVFLPFSPLVSQVHAQNLVCKIFPFIGSITFWNINSLCGGGDSQGALTKAKSFVSDAVTTVGSLIFIGIIVVAVYIIIKAAVKYIRSEGDETKIGEAQKAIKNVFLGIAALFVGIIGIVLIIAIFNAGGAIGTTDINQLLNNGSSSCLSGGSVCTTGGASCCSPYQCMNGTCR